MPRCPLAIRHRPRRRDVLLASAGFREHVGAHEQPELDADARESNSFASRLDRRGDVVKSTELGAAHAAAVVGDGERRPRGIDGDGDRRRAGVERVRDNLGEYGFLDGARVGVSEVLEQMK